MDIYILCCIYLLFCTDFKKEKLKDLILKMLTFDITIKQKEGKKKEIWGWSDYIQKICEKLSKF